MSRLKVDNIETRSGNNVAMDNALQLKSYTTAERDALTVSAGDIIYNTTTSKVEAYTGSAWTQLGGLDLKAIDYLIIAGGGGGATTSSYGGSGGGAGGYRTSYNSETSGGNASAETPHYISTGTNYVITVGAGGAITNDGNESQFGKVISVYGGRGTNHPGDRARHGGNGGSGGGSTGGRAYGVLGQGSDGGVSPQGGGGGAGAAGTTGGAYGTAEQGGNGGNGLASTITGSSVTRAGGGGASTLRATASGSAGTGGTGGGGNGSKNGTAGSGTANTGSGGGGSVGSNGVAGTGGSGFVALSYPSTLSITVGAGLTTGVSETTDGSRKYITFTGGTGTVSWS
jgi:hypothetical protein